MADSAFQLRLHRLSIRSRLFSIVVAFAIPLVILIYFTIDNINNDIRLANLEMKGTQYERPLVKILAEVGNHRLTRMRIVEGNNSPEIVKEYAEYENNIEKLLGEITNIDEDFGSDLPPHRATLHNNWNSIKSSNIDDYGAYGEMFNNLNKMIVRVGDASTLILDPDLDSYYLMDIFLNRLPKTVRRISDVAFGLYPQLIPDQPAPVDIRTEAKIAEHFFRELALETVISDMETVFKEDKNFYGISPTLVPEMTPIIENYKQKMETLFKTFRSIAAEENIKADDFAAVIYDVNNYIVVLNDATLKEIDAMLLARIDYYEHQKVYILIWYAVAQIAGLWLFFFLTTSVTTPINRLYKAIVAISEGNLNAYVPSKNYKDEIGEISRGVESFRLNLVEKVRLENERKAMEDELIDHRDHLQKLVNIQTASLVVEKEKAEQATIAKSEFLSNMSHELRTPMHAILNYASMGLKVATGNESNKLNKYLSNIQTAGTRLLGLLNSLLDFEKLEAGKMQFTFKVDDFVKVIDYAEIELDSLMKQKNIKLVKNYLCENTNAIFDEQKIIQVLVNLLSNSIKFSPEGGTIVIILDEYLSEQDAKSFLLCSIKDEGVGIPESELESVFEQFTQSTTTKTAAGGTGLGLSISRKIMEKHNGRIWAENAKTSDGKIAGAVLKFILPRE